VTGKLSGQAAATVTGEIWNHTERHRGNLVSFMGDTNDWNIAYLFRTNFFLHSDKNAPEREKTTH